LAKNSRNGGSNSVRIIGGTWRSRVIRFPDAAGLRPSPDRVRETLFNWLGQDLTGLACLDLFAGSGALGFEAASRGASSVVMLETAPEAAAALRANASLLDAKSWRLAAGDALEFLRSHRAGLFDVVFVDPPFASGLVGRVLPLLPVLLAPGARVYVESGEDLAVPEGWRVLRQGKAGVVRYHLLQKEPI
jgi:16S rRNA (guanine(966)-N(2))-methyltransferase RsmD